MDAWLRFFALSVGFALVLVVQVAARAGAPAPVPMTREPHLPELQVASLGDFRFESGAVVKDFKVSYVTYGKLNRARDNAALRSIKAKTLIVGNRRDQLIGRDDLADHAKMIPGARLVEVDSPARHAVCCGVDPEADQDH